MSTRTYGITVGRMHSLIIERWLQEMYPTGFGKTTSKDDVTFWVNSATPDIVRRIKTLARAHTL